VGEPMDYRRKNEETIFDDIMIRMEKLCSEIESREEWSVHVLAEGIKKDLTEALIGFNLIRVAK
jgi:hypothetical protein